MMLNTSILDLAERAHNATTATERAEILASLREHGSTEEELIWALLRAVRESDLDLKANRHEVYRWLDIAEFLHNDRIAAFMVGTKPGGRTSEAVLNFLQRCREERNDDLQRDYDAWLEKLRTKYRAISNNKSTS